MLTFFEQLIPGIPQDHYSESPLRSLLLFCIIFTYSTLGSTLCETKNQTFAELRYFWKTIPSTPARLQL